MWHLSRCCELNFFINLFVYYHVLLYMVCGKMDWYNYMYTSSLLILCLEFHDTRTEIRFSWSFPRPPRESLNMPLLNRSNNKQPPLNWYLSVVVCGAVYHTGGKQLIWEARWLLLSEESESTGKLKGTAVAVLQIGRSLVRSQQVSLEFFIDMKSFRSHYGPGVESASNRNEY